MEVRKKQEETELEKSEVFTDDGWHRWIFVFLNHFCRSGPHTPKPQVGMSGLANRASQSAGEMSAAKANHATTATAASTSQAASMERGNLGGTSSRSDTGLSTES